MLRRGVDFDHVVLAVSLGMVAVVAAELIADRPEWRDMTTHVAHRRHPGVPAVAAAGRRPRWDGTGPGVTTSGYVAAVRHLGVDAADAVGRGLARGRPTTHGRLLLRQPGRAVAHRRRRRRLCRADAGQRCYRMPSTTSTTTSACTFPVRSTDDGFAWHLLCGANGHRGVAALDTQHVSVNIDPSDRYVQSVPGSDKYRLRPDESGYDNLVLAGDWTDSGSTPGASRPR